MEKKLKLKLDIEEAKELVYYTTYNIPFEFNRKLEDIKDGELITSYMGIDFLMKK